MNQLESKRLILRDYTESDFEFYHSWISNDAIMEFLDWKTFDKAGSKEEFDKVLAEQFLEKRKNYYLLLIERETGNRVGNIGVSLLDDQELPTGEIGWIIQKEYWGKGYATEAAELIKSYSFNKLGLEVLYAECAKENITSEKIMKRIGMKKMKEFKQFYKQKRIERIKLGYRLLKGER